MTSHPSGLEILPPWLIADDAGRDAPRPAQAVTRLGTLGGPAHAVIDQYGLVTPATGGASVDWWVGAEDRWHVPSQTASVRQSLIGDSPVVETRMRVPGGDIVQRAYAIQDAGADGGRTLVVVQIENASAVPVALALAIRPYDLVRVGTTSSIDVDETAVRAGGVPLLGLPKPPQAVATASGADGDVAAAVFAGAASTMSGPAGARVSCPDGLAQAALVYPLTHTASITVVVPVGHDAAGGSPGLPAALPDAESVARGWATQTDRGMRLVLPDDRLQQAVDANRRYLLSFADDAAAVTGHGLGRAGQVVASSTMADVFDRYGFHDEAATVLSRYVDYQAPSAMDGATAAAHGALVSAFARHHDVVPGATAPVAGAAIPSLARTLQLIYDAVRPRRLRRRSARAAGLAADDRAAVVDGLADGAHLLRVRGEETAARSADRFVSVLTADEGPESARPAGPPIVAEVDRLLRAASPTWTWAPPGEPDDPARPVVGHDAVVAARFLACVRELFLHERDDELVLMGHVPRSWHGRNLEVHDAPTRHGTMSYALRWHGERPALLWELTPTGEGHGGVTVTCPGLDPAWTTTEASGEALLAAPAGAT